MNTGAWLRAGDAKVPSLILQMLSIGHGRAPEDAGGPLAPGSASLANMRQTLRLRGWSMEVRPASAASLLADESCIVPSLVVAGERVLLVKKRGKMWQVLAANADVLAQPAHRLLAEQDSGALDALRRWREAWRTLGFGSRMISAAERKLGLSRSRALAAWMAASPGLVRDPRAVVRYAIRAPHALPIALDATDDEPLPWLEARFRKQVHLLPGRSHRATIASLARQEWRFVAWLLLASLVAMPLGYGVSLVVAFVIDSARLSATVPWAVLGLLLGVLLFGKFLELAATYGATRLAARLRLRVMNTYLFRVVGSRLESVRTLGDGDLFTRLADFYSLQSLMLERGLPALISLLSLAGGLVYLASVAGFVFVPLGAALLCVAFFMCRYAPRLRDLRQRQLESSSTLRDRMLERIEGRRTLQHLDAAGRLFARVDPYLAKVSEYGRQATVLGAKLSLVVGVVGVFFVAITTVLVAQRFHAGSASLGGFVVVLGLSAGVFQLLMSLVHMVPTVVAAGPSLDRVREVITITRPEGAEGPLESGRGRTSAASGVHAPEVEAAAGQPAALRISDLSFRWSDDVEVLHRVGLEVAAGKWVALVGASGSGKSTLAGVLGGVLTPRSGRLILDGRETHAFSLRRRIAVVTQETFLFDRSIRDNITLGRAAVTDSDVEAAVELAGLAEFVRTLPRGLGHPVGDAGAFVSVGEKCRIGIARALVRNPGLIVFDEALSHLDPQTTRNIVSRLRDRGTSVLVMTHDLLRARECSRVLVLRDGGIAEEGTFAELASRDGAFAALLRAREAKLGTLAN